MARILIVEDDVSIQEVVGSVLRADGHHVVVAPDGDQAIERAAAEPFDLILLDVMLPSMSGFDVAMALRARTDIPILMLTACTSEGDILTGLAMGADDYLTKPFSPAVLAAKVQANLRRANRQPATPLLGDETDVLRVGPLEVDGRQWRATLMGEELALTAREFRLLSLLLRNQGAVLTREAIIERVWGDDFTGSDRVVDVCLSRLRRQLFNHPHCPVLVRAVPSVGYKLVVKEAAVTAGSEPPSGAALP